MHFLCSNVFFRQIIQLFHFTKPDFLQICHILIKFEKNLLNFALLLFCIYLDFKVFFFAVFVVFLQFTFCFFLSFDTHFCIESKTVLSKLYVNKKRSQNFVESILNAVFNGYLMLYYLKFYTLSEEHQKMAKIEFGQLTKQSKFSFHNFN